MENNKKEFFLKKINTSPSNRVTKRIGQIVSKSISNAAKACKGKDLKKKRLSEILTNMIELYPSIKKGSIRG